MTVNKARPPLKRNLIEFKCSIADWVDDNIKIIDKPQSLLKPIGYMNKEAVSDPVLVVDNVAALHIKLTDVATWVNVAFNVQLLLRITIAFVSIVTALFVIGVNFVKNNNDHEKLNLNLMFTSWAFSGAIEVWLIVWVTCKVVEEVCDNLTESFVFDTLVFTS